METKHVVQDTFHAKYIKQEAYTDDLLIIQAQNWKEKELKREREIL